MCMSCGKSKVNTGQRTTVSTPVRTVNRPTGANIVNNTFGQPKVRISFSSRNRG